MRGLTDQGTSSKIIMINLTEIVYTNKDYAPNNRVGKDTLDIDADAYGFK